jgi:ribosomal protein S18 acetylase RimI-like enzyme
MRDSIRLRAATDDDIPFLSRLYASTRQAEMQMVPWTDEEKQAFLDMQFNAQKTHYDSHYPDAEFLVIEKDGHPVGRLYVDRAPEDIRVVDIAIVPEHRGTGLGTMLLREILEEAAASSRPVTIHVERYNPALHLYDRLGFRRIADSGVYYLMRWDAPEQRAT